MAKENIQKKSKLGTLLAILIPVVILAILVAGLYYLLDSDKGREKVSGIPVLSSIFPTEEEASEHSTNEKALEKANQQINQQKEAIADLEQQISSMENVLDDKDQQIKKLEKSQEAKDETDEDQTEENDEVKQVAASFRKMEPDKAAGIVEQMDKNVAIDVMAQLSGDVRGGILEEMDAKKAAQIAEGMLH